MPKKSQIAITPKLTNQSEIVLYQPNDSIHLEVRIEEETVWLNRNQLAVLFGRDIKTIGKHINNALHEELQDMATVAKFAIVQNDRFLCIDDTVYHLGASLKDLGKKWFAFSRMEIATDALLSNMK